MSTRASGWQVIAAFGGPVIWFAHFSVMYAVNAVQCARGYDVTALGIGPEVLAALVATAAAVALIVIFWRIGERAPHDERDRQATSSLLVFLTRWLGGLSLVAILLTVVPVFVSPRCV